MKCVCVCVNAQLHMHSMKFLSTYVLLTYLVYTQMQVQIGGRTECISSLSYIVTDCVTCLLLLLWLSPLHGMLVWIMNLKASKKS